MRVSVLVNAMNLSTKKSSQVPVAFISLSFPLSTDFSEPLSN